VNISITGPMGFLIGAFIVVVIPLLVIREIVLTRRAVFEIREKLDRFLSSRRD